MSDLIARTYNTLLFSYQSIFPLIIEITKQSSSSTGHWRLRVRRRRVWRRRLLFRGDRGGVLRAGAGLWRVRGQGLVRPREGGGGERRGEERQRREVRWRHWVGPKRVWEFFCFQMQKLVSSYLALVHFPFDCCVQICAKPNVFQKNTTRVWCWMLERHPQNSLTRLFLFSPLQPPPPPRRRRRQLQAPLAGEEIIKAPLILKVWHPFISHIKYKKCNIFFISFQALRQEKARIQLLLAAPPQVAKKIKEALKTLVSRKSNLISCTTTTTVAFFLGFIKEEKCSRRPPPRMCLEKAKGRCLLYIYK